MAHAGDSFIVELTPSQLGWGTERYTASREVRYGEGYLIGHDILGQNIFHCITSDGSLNCELKSQGCVSAGDKYAKQFAGNGNLRALGDWYSKIGAKVGDRIEVSFSSPNDIVLTLFKKK